MVQRAIKVAMVAGVVIGAGPAIAGVTRFRGPGLPVAAIGLAVAVALADSLFAGRRARRVAS